MPFLAAIDWHAMWVPSNPVLEVVIRGTIIYLGLVLLFRVLRRDAGSLSLADLLLVVLIADAAQNGMAGEYHSITEGIVLVVTIAFWSYLLDFLSYHFPLVAKIIEPPPTLLVRDGRMIRRNMRRELITPEELHSQMRLQGIADLRQVKRCFLEPDGNMSVIASHGKRHPAPEKKD